MRMINGIEILSQKVIYDDWNAAFTFIMIIIFEVGISLFFISLTEKSISLLVTGIIILLIGGVCLGYGATHEDKIRSHHIEYTATVSEDISIDEIYKNYEIVKQEGKTYILRDKVKE